LTALAVVVASYIALAYFSVTGLRLRDWKIGPEPEAVADSLLEHGEYESERRTILTLLKLFTTNDAAYHGKVDAIRPSLIALVVETVASALVLGIVAHR